MTITPNQVTLAAMAFDKALEGVELTTATKLMAIRAALEAAGVVGPAANAVHALDASVK